MEEIKDVQISAETRAELGETRRALLKLHKALLEDERVQFERARGRVESSGALLQLVLHDEWFAYLRPLSALVVQIDELLDADEASEREAFALKSQAVALLTSDAGSAEGLGEKYRAALQRAPEVVMEHAGAVKTLNARKKD